MKSQLLRLDVGVTRVDCLKCEHEVICGRKKQKDLPKMNDGDLGPRIMDNDDREKCLNSTYVQSRAASPTAAEEETMSEEKLRAPFADPTFHNFTSQLGEVFVFVYA